MRLDGRHDPAQAALVLELQQDRQKARIAEHRAASHTQQRQVSLALWAQVAVHGRSPFRRDLVVHLAPEVRVSAGGPSPGIGLDRAALPLGG